MKNLNMKTFVLTTALFLGSFAAQAEPIPPISASPTDFMAEQPVLEDLSQDKSPVQDRAVEMVLAHSDQFTPLVIYATSRALFIAGRKDEASQWFYSAQVRARFDAMRCPDASARQATTILTDVFGPPINRYTFQRPDTLKKVVHEAVAWDRSTPHNYDHRWICAHGIGVIDEKTPGPERWNELAEQVRTSYLSNFERAFALMSSGEFELNKIDENDPRNKFELNRDPLPSADEQSDDDGCEDCVYPKI